MRIFFHSSAQAIYRHAVGIPACNGTPVLAKSTIRYLQKAHFLTGNKGNMIHSEALLKLFEYNNSRSSVGNLCHVFQSFKSPNEYQTYIKNNFDCVFLSMANFIRKNMNHTNLVQVLEQTNIEIYVFGAGMQDKLPPDLSKLSESTQQLLKIFNTKARLFGVRGEYTQNWLQEVGFKNTQLLGCPSMYVYPLSVINGLKTSSIAGNKLLTAGHISKKNLMGTASKAKRALGIVEIFQHFSPSYVFQDEPFTYDELFDVPCIYSDATSQFDSDKITEYISGLCKQEIPFQSYYMFHQTGAWRQVCQRYDIYIGDRFHGGIVALQSGIPSVFIASDQRIIELCEFFGLPHTTFQEIKEVGVSAVIRKKLSPDLIANFKRTYVRRLREFRECMLSLGFTLANAPEIEKVLSMSFSNSYQ